MHSTFNPSSLPDQARFPSQQCDNVPGKNPPKKGQSETNWDYVRELAISDLQFRAIRFTLNGKNDTDISAALGVSRRTLYRWKKHDQNYRAVLESFRSQLIEATGDMCQKYITSALDALASTVGETVSETTRVYAADALLRHARKLTHPVIRPALTDKACSADGIHALTYYGRVKDGAIVLDVPDRLPEASEVEVRIVERQTPGAQALLAHPDLDPAQSDFGDWEK